MGPLSPPGEGRIYVQVPAYRDAELLSTITDLLATAADRSRLTVAIAWQHGDDERAVGDALEELAEVRLLRIPAGESGGCNWARRLLQQDWRDEQYTLLLDSHHRFAPGWDDILVELLEAQRRLGHDHPIITGYLPPYRPGDSLTGRTRAVYELRLQERRAGLAYRLHGRPVEGWQQLQGPVPERFASLHLLFADGSFNQIVPSDPDIYFFADEVAVAVRAYTHGYDLFRPHVVVGWHLYDRATRVTHWADHGQWQEHHERSLARLPALYGGTLRGPYGIGAQRSIADYEQLAGLRLIDHRPTTMEEARSWSSHLSRAIGSPRSTAGSIPT